MNDQRILEALRALAESDRDKEAAPEVEIRLRRAFQRRRLRRTVWRAAAWAAAAAGIAVAFSVWHRNGPLSPRSSPAAASVAPVNPTVEPEREVTTPQRKAARVRARRPREVVTEFFPLIDVAPPFERGELVRVNLPASVLRTVGLPVSEDRLTDRVEADVLVGEEGLARAIRFVKPVE
jgi:hypothetical protein